MSIHTAIQEFTERYDSEAIASIDYLPSKIGHNADMISLNVFNLKESCDKFTSYLRGYRDYMKLNKDNPKKTSREGIKASMESYLNSDDFFKECEIKYNRVPEFVKSYLESLQNIVNVVDTIKEDMEFDGVGLEYVGDVNDYADEFLARLNERFDPVMNNILWASGYNGAHRSKTPSEAKIAHKVTFL